MLILVRLKALLAPLRLFVFFIIAVFLTSISPETRANHCYGRSCDISGIYWEPAPKHLPCKHPKKKHYVHKKKVMRHYYFKVIHVPVYSRCNSCERARCCYEDCCGNYNPDLTTGDDDPSVYPDLNIDR